MDQTDKRPYENTREPLPHGNSGCISTELHVASEQEVMQGKAPFTVTIAAWDMDGLRYGFARVVAPAQPDQAEVPMTDTPPMDPRVQQLVNDTLCTGTALALAQSMKVLGQQAAYDGHEGWAVLARRAEQFVRAMHMHVTRFLQQPDCHLRHASLDFDLLAAHVDVSDVGRVTVHCTDADGGGWHPFPLEELNAAGPLDDAVRAMVAEMAKALVQDHIGQAIAAGMLPGFDTFNSAIEEARVNEGLAPVHVAVDEGRSGGDQTAEVVASRDADGNVTVHHLQVHDEYVLGEDGPHAEAVGFDPPQGDDAFAENGS